MRRIDYYVAISIDGYIDGGDGDVSKFTAHGPGVQKYLADLQSYDTVIMGRNTYEFGYRFGLEPGQPPYPHMQHYVFSESLQFETPSPSVHVVPLEVSTVRALKSKTGGDIYLCGGGQFAGWALEHKLIDRLILKLNPIVLGRGTRLFGTSNSDCDLKLTDLQPFEDISILTYEVRNNTR